MSSTFDFNKALSLGWAESEIAFVRMQSVTLLTVMYCSPSMFGYHGKTKILNMLKKFKEFDLFENFNVII